MIVYLENRNIRLLQLAEHLSEIISSSKVPEELEPFKRFVIEQCDELSRNIKRNLQLLQIRKDFGQSIKSGMQVNDFLKEILGETRKVNYWLFRLSEYYAPPILRSHPHDRLSLNIIGWLHRSNPDTESYPPLVNSGTVSIESLGTPPVYYFPVVEQHGLLYQPLVIHEYGHFLYKIHKREMDDLVVELQEDALHLLQSSRYRNDLYSHAQAQTRREIANTWYAWTQELFCDAVGLTMGGPSYLYAFSSYLHTLQESDFRREPAMLKESLHPPRWLRVQFLVRRANHLNLTNVAREIVSEWESVQALLGITEDYYGYYSPDLDKSIDETIDDMMIETDPRRFDVNEISASQWDPTCTPILLLNLAWQVYRNNPNTYISWEQDILSKFFRPTVVAGSG